MFGSPAACRYCCGRPSRKSAAALPVYWPLNVKLPFGRLMNASKMRSRRISRPLLMEWRPKTFVTSSAMVRTSLTRAGERLLGVAEREEPVDADVRQSQRRLVARRDRESRGRAGRGRSSRSGARRCGSAKRVFRCSNVGPTTHPCETSASSKLAAATLPAGEKLAGPSGLRCSVRAAMDARQQLVRFAERRRRRARRSGGDGRRRPATA